MKRLLASVAVFAVTGLLLAAPAARADLAPPADKPCRLLKRSEVGKLLLGKRVVKVETEKDAAKEAARCTWSTRFYQAPSLKKLHAAFGLRLDTQTKAGAAGSLDELRSAAAEVDSNVDRVDGVGDEAYRHFGELVVVTGDVVFQVGLHNFDEAKKPHPNADDIAERAAQLVLSRLGS